jgi:predicted ATPase
VFWPLLLSIQAGAHALAGRVADGLALVDQALEIAGRAGGRNALPEFCLLKGDLLTAAGVAGADPEPWFQRAFDMAESQEARMSQLRAAVRLCRLRRDQGRVEEGRRMLAGVYDTFTEGFATADLTEARTLLESLP